MDIRPSRGCEAGPGRSSYSRLASKPLAVSASAHRYDRASANSTAWESSIKISFLAANVTEVPDARATAIATSTAQSDPGVFELNFRDERYMPFEGAGAVSAWRLTLPKSFRQFDYATINDVVLRLAYTAKADGALRTATEALNAAAEGTILNVLANQPLVHVVSLRNEFSNALNRLLHSPAGTDATFTLTKAHLPFFLSGRDVTVSSAKLVLRTKPENVALGALAFDVDGTGTGAFAAETTLGDLPAVDVTAAFAGDFADEHTIRVTNAGGLAPENPVAGDPSGLDKEKLLDLLFVLEVAVA